MTDAIYQNQMEKIMESAEWIIVAYPDRIRITELSGIYKKIPGFLSVPGSTSLYSEMDVYIEDQNKGDRRAIKLHKKLEYDSDMEKNINKSYWEIRNWIEINISPLVNTQNAICHSVTIVKSKSEYYIIINEDRKFKEIKNKNKKRNTILLVETNEVKNNGFYNITKKITQKQKEKSKGIISNIKEITRPGIDFDIIKKVIRTYQSQTKLTKYHIKSAYETDIEKITRKKYKKRESVKVNNIFPKTNWLKENIRIDKYAYAISIHIFGAKLIIGDINIKPTGDPYNQRNDKYKSLGTIMQITDTEIIGYGAKIMDYDEEYGTLYVEMEDQKNNQFRLRDCKILNTMINISIVNSPQEKTKNRTFSPMYNIIHIENNESNHTAVINIISEKNIKKEADIQISNNQNFERILLNAANAKTLITKNSNTKDLYIEPNEKLQIEYIDFDKKTINNLREEREWQIRRHGKGNYIKKKYNSFSILKRIEEDKGNLENAKEMNKILKKIDVIDISKQKDKRSLARMLKIGTRLIFSNNRTNIALAVASYIMITFLFTSIILAGYGMPIDQGTLIEETLKRILPTSNVFIEMHNNLQATISSKELNYKNRIIAYLGIIGINISQYIAGREIVKTIEES